PFIVQGFMPFKEEGTDKILKEYGNIEKFLAKYSGIQKEIKSDLEVSSAITAHADAELLLLKIGILLGYETYSPDRNEVASEEKLSKYITLTEVPLRFLGKQLIPLVKEIDIIWFKDEVPKFAFEVEHSTKFGNGFQRMCQLIPLSTKLFIISSTKNSHLFEKFINTDPYYKHKKSFRFRDYTQLENYFTAVARLHAINDAFLK
ncbi:MAG: hypothetical protein OEV55_09385, partial [candidate division Zixibacteria bacterium]|nr:hypothetical protein [candidate division Zixibacteria bacterium]